MNTLSVDHLLGIKYLKEADIHLIFETADHFKEVINRPIKKVPSLRDVTIANLFFENSTRTKLSFELAEKRLSADILNFSAAQSSVKKGETLIDTVNNILAMKVDMVVMRHPIQGQQNSFLKMSMLLLSTQEMEPMNIPLRLYLMLILFESVLVKSRKRIVIVGDILHSRVALSNIFALNMLGAEVKVWAQKPLA